VVVLGAPLGRGALVLSFFYFKTGADKLVDLIWYGQVTLAELSINVITWISVPNETDDLQKDLTVSPKRGITCLKKYERSPAHSGVF
jgi:hypothetical protein